MKMNGWKRIGIIASIVWAISAWFYTDNMELHRDIDMNYQVYEACAQAAGNDAAKETACFNAQMAAAERDVKYEHEAATGMALLPLPFAWGFAYLALFVTRWIKRGFQGAQ